MGDGLFALSTPRSNRPCSDPSYSTRSLWSERGDVGAQPDRQTLPAVWWVQEMHQSSQTQHNSL